MDYFIKGRIDRHPACPGRLHYMNRPGNEVKDHILEVCDPSSLSGLRMTVEAVISLTRH